jgi:DNA polymerase
MQIPGIDDCRLCPLWQTRTQVIRGEGSLSSEIFLLAQAPGEEEDEAGKMFVGPSGKLFWELLDQAKADRADLYISNLLKCRLPQNRRPKQAEILSCSRYLEWELAVVKPRIVAPLGYYATKFIFESRKLGMFNKEEYPSLIGRAFVCAAFIVMPLSHPTSLIHHPEFWEHALKKYRRVFQLEPCKWFNCCPIRAFTLNRALPFHWTDAYCLGNWQNCQRFELESRGIAHSDHLLPDGSKLETL